MIKKLYPLYALLVTGGMAYAMYFGWSYEDVDQVKQVPKSVRDNPGSYRSIYRSHVHYYGGK